jgi:hypothetical protein
MSILSRSSCLLVLSLAVAACDRGPKTTAAPAASASPTAKAVEPAGAPEGKTFGAGVKLAETTPIDTILANPKAFQGKTLRVEGMITDVCQQRGCWMELAGTAPGQKLRFKVVDGEMTFPVDAKGQHAVAEGVLSVHELSLEETKEYAEEQAKESGTAFDPATVTKPTVIARLDGTGAVIRPKK